MSSVPDEFRIHELSFKDGGYLVCVQYVKGYKLVKVDESTYNRVHHPTKYARTCLENHGEWLKRVIIIGRKNFILFDRSESPTRINQFTTKEIKPKKRKSGYQYELLLEDVVLNLNEGCFFLHDINDVGAKVKEITDGDSGIYKISVEGTGEVVFNKLK